MSLYNVTCGNNPLIGLILASIQRVQPIGFDRLRDAYLDLQPDGSVLLAVYTRCGGGNREEYQSMFTVAAGHPLFVREEDSDFDNTYATLWFKAPEHMAADFKRLAELAKMLTVTPATRFETVMADLENKPAPVLPPPLVEADKAEVGVLLEKLARAAGVWEPES